LDYRNRCGKIAHSHSDIKFPFPKYCFAVLSLLLSQSYSDTKWPHVDHLGLPQLSLPHLRLPHLRLPHLRLPEKKRKAGQSTTTKASSGQKNPSTAGTSNLFTPEQLALFNSMQAQLNAQKKTAAAAQDEGTLV